MRPFPGTRGVSHSSVSRPPHNIDPYFSAKAASKATCWGKIEPFDELGRFPGPRFTIHPHVFPFDRQRTVNTDLIQRADDLLEIHAAAPGERKSQPRRGSPKFKWLRQDTERPLSVTIASLTWT